MRGRGSKAKIKAGKSGTATLCMSAADYWFLQFFLHFMLYVGSGTSTSIFNSSENLVHVL
jgi:hypothetical protein